MSASVLIVDDSLTVRMDLAELFKADGYDVRHAATCAGALETLAAHRTDLVILDVILPDGDGVELLRELRQTEHGEHAVVIMLSSESEVRDRIRALETGAEAYIAKPYDRGLLVAKARELLRGRTAPQARENAHVLVIDDSATYRDRLVTALTRAGYRTSEAATGEEGLRRAAEQRPDAVIVDGVMPGIDGATVIRHIRLDLALRLTPCVLFTSLDDAAAELTALDAGADAFVHKSVDIDVVLARLAAVMRNAAAADTKEPSLLGPHAVLAVFDGVTSSPIAEALREDGLDVVVARSAQQAIDLLAVQPVHCIVLGLASTAEVEQTCRRIRGAPVVRDLPIIVITPTDDRARFLEALGAGADDCIAATVEPAIVKARVRSQLRRKQVADDVRRTREERLVSEELERQNRELDAFSYSVAHDLRAPLRSISGFSNALVEDYGPQLDERARDYLQRVQTNARRMAELIEDLLGLAKVGRAELRKQRVDLAPMARAILRQLAERDRERQVEVVAPEKILLDADRGLLQALLENLLSNAWKFTSKCARARIEIGQVELDGVPTYFVRDNGAGFDAAHAARLFRPFQRLHASADFEGTGIGLATVQRIVARHGGRVWAEGETGAGATFYFTL